VSPAGLAALGADDLLAFSRQRGAGLGRTAWNHLATALPGFYRWLDLPGHGGAHLAGAVPSRRRYRFADVPCALSWSKCVACSAWPAFMSRTGGATTPCCC